MCPRVGVAGIEGLAVVHALCTAYVVVGQQVARLQFLALVLRYHLQPGLNHLVLLGHLIGEVASLLARGQYHEVVDAILSRVDTVVVGTITEFLVHYGKILIGALAQRQIDRLLRVVGYRLGIGLGTYVHQVENLLGLGRDNLIEQLLLRVDELRIELRTVAQGHVAYQVILHRLAILAYHLTIGNLQYRAVLYVLAHIGCHAIATHAGFDVVEHAVGHGADGRHWCYHHVLYRTDVQVGIGTHHRWVAAGADVVAYYHGVREGLAAVGIVHQHVDITINIV